MGKARKHRVVTAPTTTTSPLADGATVRLAGDRIAEIVADDRTRVSPVLHARTVDTLGILYRNGTIDRGMYLAARRFASMFAAAGLQGVSVPALDRIPGQARAESYSERLVEAREEVMATVSAVGGIASPAGSALWHVVGLGQSLREWAVRQGWNGRTLTAQEARGVFIAALGMLAPAAEEVG